MKVLAALAFLASTTTAFAAPMEITAAYRVTNSGITIARINESFVRKGDSYTIQSVLRSEGVLKALIDDQLTLESTGRFGASGLQPLEFGQRRAKDPKRDIKSTFDWDKGIMRTMLRGEHSEVALPPDTQDRISVMYQFMNLPEYGQYVVMPMASGRRVELYTYRLVGEVKITTPAGEFQTLHYERIIDNDKDTRAEVWLAKDRFNFPVRVVFDDPKGIKLEQTLENLQQR